MALPGERLLLAATLDEVQEGELFDTLPPHMSLVRWANIQESRRARVQIGLNNIFSDQFLYQEAVGKGYKTYRLDGEKVHARKIELPEKDLNFRDSAHSLIKSLGQFDPEDPYADTKSFLKKKNKFRAHVTDTPERVVSRLESISFRTVALFALNADNPEHIHTVLASYQLAATEGKDNG